MLYYERELKKKGFDFIIGVDEAGRGPLAGPVVAAAALLKANRFKNRIDDSKKLSALQRQKAFREITAKSVFGIAVIDEKVIDRINILEASRLAMEKAVSILLGKMTPQETGRAHVIADGNMRLRLSLPYKSIIKGDSKSKTIASASILAKVTRDRIMDKYNKIYPQYKFSKNKGYPTEEHRRILKEIGPSVIHRKSFSCV